MVKNAGGRSAGFRVRQSARNAPAKQIIAKERFNWQGGRRAGKRKGRKIRPKWLKFGGKSAIQE